MKQPEEQQRAFEQLFASFENQTNKSFRVNLVCNTEQALPEMPHFIKRIDVSLPPNQSLFSAKSQQEAYESIRTDKGKRVRAGLDCIVPDRDIVMVHDDDDLIHRRFVEFVMSGEPNEIRFVEKGYKWISGTTQIFEKHNFHKSCGTSLVIPARYYKIFSGASDENEAISELGSHILPFANMLEAGYPARPLDFFAAAYRVRGSNSTQVQVQQASQREHSPLVILFRKSRARLRRIARRVKQVDQNSTEAETHLDWDSFQRDFLGGRPAEGV